MLFPLWKSEIRSIGLRFWIKPRYEAVRLPQFALFLGKLHFCFVQRRLIISRFESDDCIDMTHVKHEHAVALHGCSLDHIVTQPPCHQGA